MILPKLTIYRPADTWPQIGWNEYHFEEKTLARTSRRVIIGAYVVAFKRCFSLVWRRP